jgi:hypothetical protein
MKILIVFLFVSLHAMQTMAAQQTPVPAAVAISISEIAADGTVKVTTATMTLAVIQALVAFINDTATTNPDGTKTPKYSGVADVLVQNAVAVSTQILQKYPDPTVAAAQAAVQSAVISAASTASQMAAPTVTVK